MAKSIRDKVFGALFGYAIGDALGLGTEFMSRKEVNRFYPNGLTDYSQIIRDAHRAQWKRGECSTDTIIVLEQLKSLIENKGINYSDIASRYHRLYKQHNVDLTTNLRWVLSQPDYPGDPFGTTQKVWDSMKKFDASNECLGRAFFVGIWDEDLPQTAVTYCRLTHAHSRCEAASAIIAKMAASLMWEDKEASFDSLIDMARSMNADLIRYIDIARHGTLEDLHLDDPDTFWFVRRLMACALWAIWHCDSPTDALHKIIMQGGDADTNAALAQGMLGLKYGYEALDPRLIEGLLDKEMIETVANDLTHLLEERKK
ncbi:MAG: ADP-ribosylglycohydrolase family protein [Muribaculaceae bacterium]|nr:ADP-ribosylglycohydrolase family protein [Muribaculaceae bacterium]